MHAYTRCEKKSNPLKLFAVSQQPLAVSVWNFTCLRDYPIYIEVPSNSTTKLLTF